MQNRNLFTTTVARLTLVGALLSASSPLVAQPGLDEAAPIAGSMEMEAVAIFFGEDGRTVEFYAFPETGDLIYSEHAPIGSAEIFPEDSELSILERYLALAPEGAAVPQQMLDLQPQEDEQYLLEGRTVEPPRLAPLTFDLPQAQPPGGGTTAATGGSCGPQGPQFFLENHCYYENTGLLAPNRKQPKWSCHNGAWVDVTGGTGSLRKNSYSRTVACGTSAWVVHWYKAGGIWYWAHSYEFTVQANHFRTVFKMGGGWFKRRVRHWRQGNSGFVRAYSEFSNP